MLRRSTPPQPVTPDEEDGARQIHLLLDLPNMRAHQPTHVCWCNPELEDFEPLTELSTWRHRTFH